MKQNNLVPKGWKRVRLREIVDVRLSNVDKKLYSNELPVLLCNYLEVYQNDYITKSLNFMKGTVNRTEFKKFTIAKGDVIITKDSEDNRDIAKSAFVKEDINNLVCGYHLALLKPKKDVDGLFLSKILKLESINKFFQLRANGITRFGLTKETIETAEILIPPLSEQRKIAEILETIDNVIEKTERIIEKYKRIKQGLMQELLTKGIDEKGQIRSEETHRFKDSSLGRIPEEWEVVELSKVTDIVDPHPSHRAPEEKDDGIPFAGIGDLDEQGNLINENCRRVSFNIYIEQNKRFSIEEGDIAFGRVASIGKVIKLNPKSVITYSPTLSIIKPNSSVIKTYLFYTLKDKKVQDQISFLLTGTTRSSLGIIFLRKLLIPLPPLPEQRRITEILSHVDKVIKKEEKYKEKLERIKQGLMEDLLTGKVRVNHLIEENRV